MAQLVVRNLEDAVKAGLMTRARKYGRSMEEEVREILRAAVAADKAPRKKLGAWFTATCAGVGFEGDIEEHQGHAAEPPPV